MRKAKEEIVTDVENLAFDLNITQVTFSFAPFSLISLMFDHICQKIVVVEQIFGYILTISVLFPVGSIIRVSAHVLQLFNLTEKLFFVDKYSA